MSSYWKTCISEILLLIAFAVPVFGAGCERQPDPPVEPRSAASARPQLIEAGGLRSADAAITARVKTALMADDQVKGLAIDVDTRDGAVTLKGALDNQAQVVRAVGVARGVEGVRDVINRLSVKGEDKAAKTNQG